MSDYVKNINETPPEEYLKNNGRDYHTPLVLGSWLDMLCLGLTVILLALWLARARKRDNIWVRAMVFYSAAMAVLATVLIQMQCIRYLALSFGFWGGIGEITCTSIACYFTLRMKPGRDPKRAGQDC